MMFSGLRGKKKKFDMSGVDPDVMTPGGGIGGGLPGAQTMQEQPKPGFFDQGGTGRGIAGSVGDFLLQNSGFDPIYAPQQRQQQAMDLRQRNAEQSRAADMQDWQAKETWKRENPAAQGPTAQQRNFEYYQGLDDPGRQSFTEYLDAVTPKLVTGADGRTYPVRRGAKPPPPAAGQVKDGFRFKGGNPADPNSWEPVGGQTQPASGNFQR